LAIALTGYTAFQAVPLPSGLVHILSPHAADIWARALHPLSRAGPSWHPLTLDPQATRVQVLRGFTYTVIFFGAVSMSSVATERVLLERALVILPVIVAVATVAHIGLDAHRLWGVYAPRTGVGMIAPFFNHNQLSGFLDVGLLVAAGSLFAAEPTVPRALAAATVIGLGAMVVFLGSRGALIAAVGGLAVVGGLSWRSGRAIRKRADTIVPALVACAGVAIVVFASHDAMRQNLQHGDFSKLLVTKTSLLVMTPEFPIFGVGRGSFESTFPEFRHDAGWFVSTHPENVIAQWTTEWGIPVAVLALGTCAFALRPRAVMMRSHPAVGAFAALVALFLQNLVDFSSEFPGVVMALAVCAALVVGGSSGRRSKARLAIWSLRPKQTSYVLAVAVLSSAAFACVGYGHDVSRDRANALTADDGLRDDSSDVVNAIRAHPAEPYFAYVAATRAARVGNPRVIAWVDHALERAPVYGPAHLVLARWLRTRSPAQSRLEYRLAQEQGGVDVPVAEIAGLARGYYEAVELAPRGDLGVDTLNGLSQTMQQSYPATSVRLDEEIISRHPRQPDVLARAAEHLWRDVENVEPWCPACETDALHAADALEAAAPSRCDGYLVHARVLVAEGRRSEALGHLRSAIDRVERPTDCVAQLARLAISAGDDEEATRAITRLADYPCAGADDCAHDLLVAAQLENRRHNANRSLVYLRRAREVAPGREDVIAAEASVAGALGFHAEALRAFRELLALHPESAEYRQAAQVHSAALQSHTAQ
jgi:tetratricopeptide (TPR) repeat protein